MIKFLFIQVILVTFLLLFGFFSSFNDMSYLKKWHGICRDNSKEMDQFDRDLIELTNNKYFNKKYLKYKDAECSDKKCDKVFLYKTRYLIRSGSKSDYKKAYSNLKMYEAVKGKDFYSNFVNLDMDLNVILSNPGNEDKFKIVSAKYGRKYTDNFFKNQPGNKLCDSYLDKISEALRQSGNYIDMFVVKLEY